MTKFWTSKGCKHFVHDLLSDRDPRFAFSFVCTFVLHIFTSFYICFTCCFSLLNGLIWALQSTSVIYRRCVWSTQSYIFFVSLNSSHNVCRPHGYWNHILKTHFASELLQKRSGLCCRIPNSFTVYARTLRSESYRTLNILSRVQCIERLCYMVRMGRISAESVLWNQHDGISTTDSNDLTLHVARSVGFFSSFFLSAFACEKQLLWLTNWSAPWVSSGQAHRWVIIAREKVRIICQLF